MSILQGIHRRTERLSIWPTVTQLTNDNSRMNAGSLAPVIPHDYQVESDGATVQTQVFVMQKQHVF